MRRTVARLVLGCIAPRLGSHDSLAQFAYDCPWCTIHTKTSGAVSCYHSSFQQCMACVRNPCNAEHRWERDPADSEPCLIQTVRIAMQTRSLGMVILAPMLATAAQPGMAQNYPWCLVNDQKGTTSCTFVSRAQCLLSTGGNVGHCVANPASPSLPGPVRGLRRPNG
jgi:hypothetical protein